MLSTRPESTGAQAPVPLTRLDFAEADLLEELMGAVREVAERGAFTLGEHVEGFEREFAAYCETDHAVGVSSGTEALVLALRALDIGPGDEVIVPSNSFIATAEAVSLVGATPRLVDVEEDSHLITAEILERSLGPKVRCVIPVHLSRTRRVCTSSRMPARRTARATGASAWVRSERSGASASIRPRTSAAGGTQARS